ncbi:hypothetical protein [Nocardia tengchongensis]|uniref:hypothetical protein n=1 Tax=Nocardia tengchongensis TaxID=2055889 RepID=UPI003649016F
MTRWRTSKARDQALEHRTGNARVDQYRRGAIRAAVKSVTGGQHDAGAERFTFTIHVSEPDDDRAVWIHDHGGGTALEVAAALENLATRIESAPQQRRTYAVEILRADSSAAERAFGRIRPVTLACVLRDIADRLRPHPPTDHPPVLPKPEPLR